MPSSTRLRVSFFLLALGCASACSSPASDGEGAPGEVGALVAFEPLISTRASCHGTEEGEATLRDATAWSAWWEKASCGTGQLPLVDFSRKLVLGVEDREGPTGCYSVRITEVRTGVGGGYQVVVNRHVPGRATPCPMVIVHPAVAVAVPVVRGPVVFEWVTVEGAAPVDEAPR